MKTEINKNFKNQFKLSFIKSLKLGFSIDEIKKSLKNQSYPSETINRLIEEFKTDKEVIELAKKTKKPSIIDNIKNKLFKVSESAKIQRVAKIHSLFYNIILDKKRKFSEKYTSYDDILNNIENKKLINFFLNTQESYNKDIQKNIKKIRNMSRTLIGAELKQEYKDKINSILEFTEKEESEVKKENRILEQIKQSIGLTEELKAIIKNDKFDLRKKENSIQKLIDDISKKSEKFKEIISQM
jgi:DNA-binding transcriptional MerR regulator